MQFGVQRDYIPISRQFPGRKEIGMDDGATAKRKAPDLRVHALKSQAGKRQCPTPQPLQPQQPNLQPPNHQQQQQQPIQQPPSQQQDHQQHRQQQHHQQEQQQQEQVPGRAMARTNPSSNASEGSNATIKPVIDFSAFNSQTRQQQQTSAPSLYTFDDLATGGRGLRMDTDLDDLIIWDTKLPPTGRSRDGFRSRDAFGVLPPAQNSKDGSAITLAAGVAGTAAAAAAPPAAAQYDLSGLASVPWDWSLKTRLKLASARAFSCLQGSLDLTAACHVVSSASCTADSQHLSLQERLERSLLQWQHPAQQLPPQALAAMQETKATQEMLSGRCTQWRGALRSLLACVRHGECQVAYMVDTQGRQGGLPKFTAVFCAPGTLPSCPSEPCAVLTRSTRALRQALDHAGVSYTIQAAAVGPTQAASAPAGVQDGSAASQLLVHGERSVLGLCHALLQLPWCSGGWPDVPLLLAPVSFGGAALSTLSIRVLPHTTPSQPLARTTSTSARPSISHTAGDSTAGPSGSSSASERLHYAECCGQMVAPWTLQRLLNTLKEVHSEFEVYLDTEASSAGLNSGMQAVQQGVGGEMAVAEGAAVGRGGLSAVELGELQGPRLSQVVRQLKCAADGAGFSVKLAVQ